MGNQPFNLDFKAAKKAGVDFSSVLSSPDPKEQLDCLLRELNEATNACFSLKTNTRREADPPWINSKVRCLARKRSKINKREGRSHQWKALKKKSRALVRKRAAKYWENQKRPLHYLVQLCQNVQEMLEDPRATNLVINADGRKVGHAARSRNLFRQIVRIAELKGMKVNALKTLLMCISDSRTYEAGVFMVDNEGTVIESGKAMKILGLHFTSRPDALAQVDAICQKFRRQVWYLRHLHHNCFRQAELLSVYKLTVLLSCQDYCSSVFHSSITLSQCIKLERQHPKASKAI